MSGSSIFSRLPATSTSSFLRARAPFHHLIALSAIRPRHHLHPPSVLFCTGAFSLAISSFLFLLSFFFLIFYHDKNRFLSFSPRRAAAHPRVMVGARARRRRRRLRRAARPSSPPRAGGRPAGVARPCRRRRCAAAVPASPAPRHAVQRAPSHRRNDARAARRAAPVPPAVASRARGCARRAIGNFSRAHAHLIACAPLIALPRIHLRHRAALRARRQVHRGDKRHGARFCVRARRRRSSRRRIGSGGRSSAAGPAWRHLYRP